MSPTSPDSGVRIQALGALRAWRHATELDLGPAARRTLLGHLVLAEGHPRSHDDLVRALWPGDPPRSAANVIHTHVKHLRQLFEPDRPARARSLLLPTVGEGYALRVDAIDVDLVRFHDLIQRARAAGDDAIPLLGEAVRLWRGAPLSDVPALANDPKVIRLVSQWQAVLLRYADTTIAAGDAADVLPLLEETANAQPMNEALQARLISAYHAVGARARAFAAYRTVRRRLVDELGVDPGPHLVAAHEALLRDEPSAPPTAPVPEQLPADVHGFMGRDAALTAMDGLLTSASNALVICVVAGMPGVGKTALAVHWAHRRRDDFPDGQLYFDLRGYDPDRPVDPARALSGFLAALGVPPQTIAVDLDARAAQFRSATAGRRMLIVLDNAAEVAQVRPLLPGTPSSMVVVTSRDSMAALTALHGARRLDLGVLPDDVAGRLLRTLIGGRAVAAPRAVASLTELCAHLPLALRLVAEIAAARPHTPLPDLVEELADERRRLRLLDVGESRGAVRAVFSWSYHHLPPAVRRAFRLLGLYPLSEIEAYSVAALTGDPAEVAAQLLDALSRANLVRPVGRDRWHMHELLRVYAAELAVAEESDADRNACVARLLDHYLAAAAAAMDLLHPAERHHRPRTGPVDVPVPPMSDAAAARRWLDTNRAGLIEICGYAAGNGWPAHAVDLAATLYRYLEGGHYTDGLTIHAHARAAARLRGDVAAEAHTLTNLGAVHRLLGRYDSATDLLRAAITLHRTADDQFGQARALSNLAIVDERQGRDDLSVRHHREALALFRAVGDRYGEAGALTNLGSAEDALGHYESAAGCHEQALRLFQQIDDPTGQAIAMANLGYVRTRMGRLEAALSHSQQALTLFRTIGHRSGEAHALCNVGDVEQRLGRFDDAAGHLRLALVIFRDLGHRYGEAAVLNVLGETMHAAGRADEGLASHTSALEIAVETGDQDEQDRARAGIERVLAAPR